MGSGRSPHLLRNQRKDQNEGPIPVETPLLQVMLIRHAHHNQPALPAPANKPTKIKPVKNLALRQTIRQVNPLKHPQNLQVPQRPHRRNVEQPQ